MFLGWNVYTRVMATLSDSGVKSENVKVKIVKFDGSFRLVRYAT
jgi:hypothetical protein